jgi:predicted DNA-binding protein
MSDATGTPADPPQPSCGIELAIQVGMSDSRPNDKERRRAGRPPAGAREGEKVKDYPQLSVRVPSEMKARLTALSAVTGMAQWRIIVEAIDCFVGDLPPTDRELVNGISERLLRAAS